MDSLEGEPDYIVYSINVLDSYYIGSTNNMKQRIHSHKSTCHNGKERHYNIPLYKFIREAEEKYNFIFNEKAFNVEALIWGGDKDFAHKIEKEVLLEYKTKSGTSKDINMLNGRNPIMTEEEYKEALKAYFQSEHGKAVRKLYEQSEKTQAYRKVYRERKKLEKQAYDKARRERKKLEKQLN
jgi:predicted GIY-YIG superfamily endonuclease